MDIGVPFKTGGSLRHLASYKSVDDNDDRDGGQRR